MRRPQLLILITVFFLSTFMSLAHVLAAPGISPVSDTGLAGSEYDAYVTGSVVSFPGTGESFTVETFVYLPDEIPYQEFYLLKKEGLCDISIDMDSSSSNFYFNVLVATGAPGNFAGFTYRVGYSSVDNEWHHIAATFDSGSQSIAFFLDGKKLSPYCSVNSTDFTPLPAGQILVGGGGEWWESMYSDELRVSSIVRYVANFVIPRTPLSVPPFTPDDDTTALWHFDEQPGSISFLDVSGNNNTLTGSEKAKTSYWGKPVASPPASITIPVIDGDGNYTVSWAASTTVGATYVLEEATDSNFTDSKAIYNGTDLNTTLTGKTSNTTSYYRVKAIKTNYIDSAWQVGANGCLVKFRVIPPKGIVVPGTDDDGIYTISWLASTTEDAGYILHESTNSGFTAGTVRTVYSGRELSAQISGRRTGATYYYRVRATKTDYISSVWKAGKTGCEVKFPATIPSGIQVPTSDIDGNYTVTWSPSTTLGVTYVLEEATDSNFTNVQTVYSGKGRSIVLNNKTNLTTYYYRVKATKTNYIDSAWQVGGNGCQVKLKAGRPASITVPTTDDDGVYPVSWSASATDGATYQLQESTNSNFTAGTVRTAYSGTELNANISGRISGQTYYYRVKAIMTNYSASYWRTGGNGCLVP
ncbi:MAG: hypothetical protein A2511_02260 [Deltaproteobacteria bacterium RIFOXYD12_FULL_50_9]|nr:MAG: hypothetical protein A2511_02260 [Deltaproteobacteria bacterium RIFOXYD12_FULL_50_9]